MGRPLSVTLPQLLREETERLSQVSLPVTAKIFLSSILKSLPQPNENQANQIANTILDFASKVWKLQQESRAVDVQVIERQSHQLTAVENESVSSAISR